MSRSSLKYVENNYSQNRQPVTAPVSNPVVYGCFPRYSSKPSFVDKLNKVLSGFLLCLVVLSLVSYYFVSDGERNMNKLGREIVALTNENIELQNKLDNMHSFNRVDSVLQTGSVLASAKKVIQVQSAKVAFVPNIKPQPINYHWTIGY